MTTLKYSYPCCHIKVFTYTELALCKEKVQERAEEEKREGNILQNT